MSARTSRDRLVPVLALAAGLVLADASIVTLALPALLRDLHTTVEGVAAVLGVYTAVLAVVVLLAGRVTRAGRLGPPAFALFALACAGCAAARSLDTLLAFRALQAAGGAAALVATFGAIDGAGTGRRLWTAAAVFGAAVGPALGGAITQALDWRAIFIAQVPLAALAALASAPAARGGGRAAAGDRDPRAAPSPPSRPETAPSPPGALDAEPRRAGGAPSLLDRRRPAARLALALLSAALTAVIFLLVLLLVTGWGFSPLGAAATVSVLPVAAIAAHALAGAWSGRAAAGCALVGAGVLCLAFLPRASAWWTIPPQLLAGIGMGLALPALTGGLLPERTPRQAASLLSLRHAGIALALLALAPLAATQLERATERAQLRGVAVVLDSSLSPLAKVQLAPKLLASVDAEAPRRALRDGVAGQRSDFSGDQLTAFDELAERADDVLVNAVGEAFRSVFLITGALALLGALILLAGRAERVRAPVAIALVVLTAAAPVAYALAHRQLVASLPALANPCRPPPGPHAGGIQGVVQSGVLAGLNRIACRYHSSREELVLALADKAAARTYEHHHGVDPRSPRVLAGGLLPGGFVGDLLRGVLGG